MKKKFTVNWWQPFMLLLCITITTLPAAAQTLVTGQMPMVEIAHASGTNLMQFPFALSYEFRLNSDEIVKKVMVGWANTPDVASAPPQNEWKSSWDGGVTYSGVVTNLPNLNLGSAIRLLDGTMVAVPFGTSRNAEPSSMVCTFNYFTSVNNGGNWSQQTGGTVTFPTYMYWMRFHRGIFQENDGTLYAPAYVAYANNSAATRSVLLKSSDNGKTWVQHSEITNPVTDGRQFNEVTVARCANGSWLAVMRQAFPSGSNYQPLMYCRSTDKGLTWSDPAYLPGLGSANTSADDYNESVDPDLLLLPNGVMALSYGRPNTHLAFSADGNGYNWTNKQITFTEVPGTLGKETTGYTAIVAINAHRLLQFGDTGANWSYPSNPSPNPFSIWSRYIDIVRPQQNRIDLKKKLSYGKITIMPASTLTYADALHPESRLSAAFDGSVDYWSGALGTNSGVFQIDLQRTYKINSIGLALLRGQEQSATVSYSADGSNWSAPVVTYTNAVHYALNYTDVTPFDARYIRVNVNGTGLIGISELELYEASSTFENCAASPATATNGQLPPGYSPNGTSSTVYGCSVQDSQGYESNRALKLIDNSASMRAGIKKIVPASNTKTLEFLCRAAAVPSGGSFNFQLLGTVSGVEGIVFYVAVFSDGKIKANNGTGWTQVGTATFPINTGTWKKIKIAANESANVASIYVDDVLAGTTGMYANPANATTLTGFGFGSNGTATYGEVIYFDDVNFYDPSAGRVAVNTPVTADESKAGLTVSVYPNPASSNGVLKITGATKGTIQLVFTGINGSTVKKMNLQAGDGALYVENPMQNIAPGVYIITARQHNRSSRCKLVVGGK